MNSIELALFTSRIQAICDEMGAVLQRAAFSPNIRERLDFSCAVFDEDGELAAQAAHIPVHLGSMAYAMRGIVDAVEWVPGDMVVVNDPFNGGTHLPDVTIIAPVFIDSQLVAYVANRAHHADIGASTPGSMPVSRSIYEEGLLLSPTKLMVAGELDQTIVTSIRNSMSNPVQSEGDFSAQIAANQLALKRLIELIAGDIQQFKLGLQSQNNYAAKLAQASLKNIPAGEYNFVDCLDDDGMGNDSLAINLTLHVSDEEIALDFSGTASQTTGNINCPLSVTAAAAYYAFRCLMPKQTPACAGAFQHIQIFAADGSLVNAQYPAAVAAGNVETSTRIVDVVLGALAQAIPDKIPAASHGSMNNLAMGARETNNTWDYYETIGGGMGASASGSGQSARQTHMTNTLNTPVEILESNYPLRVNEYSIRKHTGGKGKYTGGDGIVRDMTLLADADVTLLTERRRYSPWGLNGGQAATTGINQINGKAVAAKQSVSLRCGDNMRIETPGGGGWGKL